MVSNDEFGRMDIYPDLGKEVRGELSAAILEQTTFLVKLKKEYQDFLELYGEKHRIKGKEYYLLRSVYRKENDLYFEELSAEQFKKIKDEAE